MKLLVTLILVVGFCLATVGAAGFDKETESLALPFFAGGLFLTAVGGFAWRQARRAAPASEGGGDVRVAGLVQGLETIVEDVRQLDGRKSALSAEDFRQRLDEISSGDFFDLTSRSEEYVGILGFRCYARVWDGVAVGERLLYRAWSMATDGHQEEAMAELPLALRALERGLEEARAL